MTNIIIWAVALIILTGIFIAVFAWFYERATREISLVKTGIGGRKVIMDGGTIALPYFHEVSRVNMQTLRLEVNRSGEAALITKDRLRVDVGAEFYVAVLATEEGVARALQTLGNRIFHADKLRELIEGKLVDALRSVAARMTMDELHENRGAFVSDVRGGLQESLARNGLELDTVSLTALDQTPFTALDENNAFNAVGMRKLAEVIATSKKERAEIDSDAEVSVRRAAMEATKRKLQIELEEQEAQISQIQQVENLKAAQLAEVARSKATGEQEAAQARIAMEKSIRTADIAREQAIRAAEIEMDLQLQQAEIEHNRDIEVASQERKISVAAKSQEESKAQAAADTARATAVKASESITTARMLADADRKKQIALLANEQDLETEAARIRQIAQAEKDAAVDRAKTRLQDADAHKQEMLAEAEGQKAMNEAENALSERMTNLHSELARLETLPKLAAEMVKPAEKIDSIKINQISGLGSSNGSGNIENPSKPVVNQVLDSIMEMAVQLPALEKIGEEVGMSFENGMTNTLQADKKKGGKKKKK